MIQTSNLGKRYCIYGHPFHRILETVTWKKSLHQEFWALRNLYLSIDQGASFGIIGPNGAGKSTFLKLLSGITRPSEGTLTVNGNVSSILELGTGFHPDFSGRSNVYLNCALQGYTREQTDALMPSILAFSELEHFIDLPIRMYSTGMYLRLAFAVATAVNPDVLIVDEALAVGDEHFRNKCMNRMNEFKQQGKTILMVSHDLATVRHFCSQVALFNQGRLIGCGAPDEILNQYLNMVHQDKTAAAPVRPATENPRWGTGEIQAERLILRNAAGQETALFDTNQPMVIEGIFNINKPTTGAVFGFLLYRSDGTYVHGSNHYWHKNPVRFDFPQAGEKVQVRCEYPELRLLPGEYYITVTCYNQFDGFPQAVDHWERAHRFAVSQRYTDQHGIFFMDSYWELERTHPGRDANDG
ncbi:MAG: ABC transporter ATP-binding protein [bacterium]|jgi:ABC-type polysaccharide/polyol phosphate transport system ATPase subunit|nr:ABC transporter ATP-binding protein [bacterium]